MFCILEQQQLLKQAMSTVSCLLHFCKLYTHYSHSFIFIALQCTPSLNQLNSFFYSLCIFICFCCCFSYTLYLSQNVAFNIIFVNQSSIQLSEQKKKKLKQEIQKNVFYYFFFFFLIISCVFFFLLFLLLQLLLLLLLLLMSLLYCVDFMTCFDCLQNISNTIITSMKDNLLSPFALLL